MMLVHHVLYNIIVKYPKSNMSGIKLEVHWILLQV